MFEMGDMHPTWPQMALISAFGAAFCLCGYLLSRLRGGGGIDLVLLLLLVGCGIGFLLTVFAFYLRPRYGTAALPALILLLLGHLLIMLLLWSTGVNG